MVMKMSEEIKLNDISDELLILNKYTIDKLFKLDNCVECIALYIFYYKTAKWQKTNTIKANDYYVKKSLKWGDDKIRRTKQTLKENGLINIVQKRENGRINGWYVEVSYLIQNKKAEDIKIKVEDSKNTCSQELDSKNTQNQELVEATSGEQEINALKEYIKCLKTENEMLKNNNKEINKEKSKKPTKHKYGEYKNVLLTDEEMEKLQEEFPNDYLKRIENLSSYMESTGKPYKSHLATIRNWARKEKSKANNYKTNYNQQEQVTSNPFLQMLLDEGKDINL